jgi:hypothetical protein
MIVYKINGKQVSREEWDKKPGVGITEGKPSLSTVAYSESKPLRSQGLGCMKHQVPEMRRLVEQHRLTGIKVCNDGSLEITSRQDRAKLMKLRDCHDNDGGFGDG